MHLRERCQVHGIVLSLVRAPDQWSSTCEPHEQLWCHPGTHQKCELRMTAFRAGPSALGTETPKVVLG